MLYKSVCDNFSYNFEISLVKIWKRNFFVASIHYRINSRKKGRVRISSYTVSYSILTFESNMKFMRGYVSFFVDLQ